RTLPVVRGRVMSFLIVGALFSALPFTFIAISTFTLPSGFAALLTAATPLCTAAIGMAFLGNRPSARVIAGLIVGVVAVVVLVRWAPRGPTMNKNLARPAGVAR